MFQRNSQKLHTTLKMENYTRNEWRRCENYTRNEWRRCKATPETSGEDTKLHSKRVGRIPNYTRNEWGGYQITLETSGEDSQVLPPYPILSPCAVLFIHPWRADIPLEKWCDRRTTKTTLETSGVFTTSPPETSVDFYIQKRLPSMCATLVFHPKRVYFQVSRCPIRSFVLCLIFYYVYLSFFGNFFTRFECSFSSSPLVSSVVFHLLDSFRV